MKVRAPARELRLVVLGTGTNVGKTHVAAALVRAWHELTGGSVLGAKPVETGVREGTTSDARLLADASVFHVKQDGTATGDEAESRNAPGERARLLAPPYAFSQAVSPHLAARAGGVRIDPRVIRAWLADLGAPGRGIVVETAGGLFTPVGPGITNFDLACALEPAVWLIVAPDRLGVLHDLTAIAKSLSARRVPVVLSASGPSDASTGGNADELERTGIATPIAVFPHAPADAPGTAVAARQSILALGLAAPRPPYD